MTKHYCDRCGMECEKLVEVRVPHEKRHNGSFSAKSVEVCPCCEKEFNMINDLLIDIRFITFEEIWQKGMKEK